MAICSQEAAKSLREAMEIAVAAEKMQAELSEMKVMRVRARAWRPRRVDAESMTASCSRLATWIISATSAMRCCTEG